MTNTILHFDYPFAGPWGSLFTAAMADLAEDIATEDGMVWKIWTESQKDMRAGGIYFFSSHAAAARFREKHAERLAALGIEDISVSTRDINVPLSRLTRAPV